MCGHVYRGDYRTGPKGLGIRCPYPELFARARARAEPDAATDALLELPYDEHGLCLFHSQDGGWKRRNRFAARFRELLRVLSEDDEARYFDFAEIVLVADDAEGMGSIGITSLSLPKRCHFTGALFLDALVLEDVDFAGGVTFEKTSFERDLRAERVRFAGVDFVGATFRGRAAFLDVESPSYALFRDSRFLATDDGYVVRFERSHYGGIADFTEVELLLGSESSVLFEEVRFDDFVNFRQAHFRCQVVFDRVSFAAECEFVDTVFTLVPTTARYRGSAVEFNRITIGPDTVLHFESTDAARKMFEHDVQFSFEGQPAGIIRFQNVNFNKLKPASKERLTKLARTGVVEIGSGCIKYRFQTPPRSIVISDGHAELVVDICQTFTNYFSATSGMNLGVEIVERDNNKVTLFYFTDEDTTEARFLERLKLAEQSLWDLLSRPPRRRFLAIAERSGELPTALEASRFLNAVDGLSALMGTFFRVGARIALGRWREDDTRRLLHAIHFGAEGFEERARDLHRLLDATYSGSSLLGFSAQHNAGLLAAASAESPPTPNLTILFVAANAEAAPLALESEVKRIRDDLKRSRFRDELRFEQEWAVTIESLTQAMIELSPTVVHFAGHGARSGIFLQDEKGGAKLVSTEALSRLFALFAGTVRCVVLSSCFSEEQARAIRANVPYVIGMTSGLRDSAARAFSSGFYKAIGAGRDVEFAYALGKAAIEMAGRPGEEVPILL